MNEPVNNAPARDQLLAEQRAYYRALAPHYLDQFLDLPGGRRARQRARRLPAGRRPPGSGFRLM